MYWILWFTIQKTSILIHNPTHNSTTTPMTSKLQLRNFSLVPRPTLNIETTRKVNKYKIGIHLQLLNRWNGNPVVLSLVNCLINWMKLTCLLCSHPLPSLSLRSQQEKTSRKRKPEEKEEKMKSNLPVKLGLKERASNSLSLYNWKQKG